MLFHTAFTPKEIDEVLLSGFTGAITAIAKQLGDNIHSINMKNQVLYLHSFLDFILILATDPRLGENYVMERMKMLEESPYLLTMGREDSLETLIEANNELHLEIADIFDFDSQTEIIGYEEDLDSLDEDDLFAEVLAELDMLIDLE
jgi:hypothetical protein